MLTNELFEKVFGKNFQRQVKLVLNNKVIREGKLLLFAPKDFYLLFTLEINEKHKVIEIPVPFTFTAKKNNISFSYVLEDLTDDIGVKVKTLTYHKEYKSKYFNNKLDFNFK